MRRFCFTVTEIQYSVLLYGDCAYAIAAARQYMTIQTQIDRATTDCDCPGNSNVLTKIIALAILQRQSAVAQIACGQFYPTIRRAVFILMGTGRTAEGMAVGFGGGRASALDHQFRCCRKGRFIRDGGVVFTVGVIASLCQNPCVSITAVNIDGCIVAAAFTGECSARNRHNICRCVIQPQPMPCAGIASPCNGDACQVITQNKRIVGIRDRRVQAGCGAVINSNLAFCRDVLIVSGKSSTG